MKYAMRGASWCPIVECPYCEECSPVDITHWKGKDPNDDREFDMCVCASCDAVLNPGFNEDIPYEIEWVTPMELQRRTGWTPLDENEE